MAGTRKYYTIEEANQTLPFVKAVVADIVRQYREVSDRRDRLEAIRKRDKKGRDSVYSEEVAHIEQEFEKDVRVLQGFLDELNALGVEFKDFEKGLLDFWSKMDGRDVFLCWHLGEDEVSHWHEVDAGFAGRQSLLAGSATGTDEEVNGA